MKKKEEKFNNKADYIDWDSLRYFILKTNEDGNYKISLFAMLSTFFALRISEVLTLKWIDVYDQEQFILMEKKNNRKDGNTKPKKRLISIIPDVQEKIHFAYDKLKVRDKRQYIFLNNSKTNPKPFSRQYVNRVLKELFDKYDIKYNNLSSHSFRKTFGRKYLEENNYSEYAFEMLMDLYNHQDRRTTKIYLGIRNEEIQSIYKSLKL